MAVIDIRKARLSQQLDVLAELAGKSKPSDQAKAVYQNRLQHCDDAELERAFAVFADRGIWPTIAQVLSECGHRALDSREEQAESLARDQSLPRQDEPPPPPAWETEYGERAFRAADPRTLRELRDALERHEWTVICERTLEVTIEEKVGRVIKKTPNTVTEILALRYKTPPIRSEIPAYVRGTPAMQIIKKIAERLRNNG